MSHSEDVWVGLVIDGLKQLFQSSPDGQAARTIYKLVTSGILWADALRARLIGIRNKNVVLDLLLEHLRTLSSDQADSMLLLATLSRLYSCLSAGSHVANSRVLAEAQMVLARYVRVNPQSRTGGSDEPSAIGLAAVLRLGRSMEPHLKRGFESQYDLLGVLRTCDNAELRRELVSVVRE